LLVAVMGILTPVYNPPTGIIVAQPISTPTAPRAKTTHNFFITTSQDIEFVYKILFYLCEL